MELLLGGIMVAAAAAFFLVLGAYLGQIAAQAQGGGVQQPQEQENPLPLTEEEQRQLAEQLSWAAANMASGIAETFGMRFADFSQVIVGSWQAVPDEDDQPQGSGGGQQPKG